ncbi:MAG TPA: YfhO family protein [Candidatus Acidoferrum sp.]
MTRSTAKHLALLALAVALFYWKTLLTNQFTAIIGSEGVNLTYSWLHFWVNSIWQGRVPLWDPYAFCGRPFAGEMLPSAFYPLHLLFALVPLNRNGLISPRFYHEFLVFTHLLCAYFMFALLRDLRLSRFAAFAGACAFALGGMVAQMMWPPYVESCIWLPAIFLFLLRALRAERRGRSAAEASLAGLCLGMSILTGGLLFAMMQGLVILSAAVYFGASSSPEPALESRPRWFRAALVLAVVLAVGCGIGAVQLIPSYEYGQLSMRFIDGGAFPASEKIPYHRMHPGVWPMSIVVGLLPFAYDGKFGGGETWTFYIGVLPFILAVIAVWKCWSHLWVRYLAGLAVVAFACALGEFSPLRGVLYAIVPYFWVIRESGRFFYLISFALAILAAIGMDALLDRTNQSAAWAPARRFLKWVAIACAAALFAPAVFGQLKLGIWTSLSLVIILASCGWFVRLTRRPAGPGLRVLLAAFILFDLGVFGWLEADKARLARPGDEMQQMINLKGAARFIKAQPGLHRVQVLADPEPNIGDVYGVQSAWGGGATLLTGFARLRAREDVLNVRYRVKRASAADPGPVYQDAHWKVYEDPNAYPRAWVVHQAVIETSTEAVFRRVNDPATDLRKTAVIEAPLRGHALEEPGAMDESVRFRSYEANRMAVDVSAGGAGLLVLSEMHYPGWRSTVNGRPAEIHRVNGALRGIPIPRGESRLELEYAPFSFYGGGAITLLTVLCVFLGLAASWWKGVFRGPGSVSMPSA